MIAAALVVGGIYALSVALVPLTAWCCWRLAPVHEPRPETRALLRMATLHPWWGPVLAAALLHALWVAWRHPTDGPDA